MGRLIDSAPHFIGGKKTMSDHRENALQYTREHHKDYLAELKEFVAIPSISTSSENAADVQQAAKWVAARLNKLGMNNVQVFQTELHPVVFGEWLGAPGKPTILLYGHYDVQPVDPIDLWKTPPFEATEQGDHLYGRGTSDMKGQNVAVFSAIDAILHTGSLPVNIKWILEGEEEIGSPSLEKFIASHKELLACDYVLNPDAGMVDVASPAITYALRGLAYFEIRIYGPSGDLHSGSFGGVVHNPALVLADLISKMHDENNRVTLPGFYDKVRALAADERAELARLPMNEKFYLEQSGVSELWGETGYTATERVGGRPTLEVNGLLSGYTAPGQKTVLPSYAMAKISTRLVPDQNPNEVEAQLRRFLEENAPKTVRWELIVMNHGWPSISDRNNAGVSALAKALETIWGKRPYFKREGGSIPVVAQMQRLLNAESALTGFALPDDNVHAPNERQHLPTFYRGIEALVHFFFNLV
jgi:acetylornithine deacetylase/succinyl-diaminopimelate desuccinylase-like protein